MFPCVIVTFPYGVSGKVWYLIVSIPDLCLLLYFYRKPNEFFFVKQNRDLIKMHLKRSFSDLIRNTVYLVFEI